MHQNATVQQINAQRVQQINAQSVQQSNAQRVHQNTSIQKNTQSVQKNVFI